MNDETTETTDANAPPLTSDEVQALYEGLLHYAKELDPVLAGALLIVFRPGEAEGSLEGFVAYKGNTGPAVTSAMLSAVGLAREQLVRQLEGLCETKG